MSTPPSKTTEQDPYKFLQIIHNPDDSLTRLAPDLQTLPSTDPTLSVLTKDVHINQSKNTSLRLFLPNHIGHSGQKQKLPLIVFFHGGGFIFQSAATTMYHDLCVKIALTVEAIVASVDYRLASESRLPAAYDDGMEALHWIQTNQDEEWLTRYTDYSNCYIMGGSAGGNLAYHAGLRAAVEVRNLEPLKIQGLILRQPFFGGIVRTDSELRMADDPLIPLFAVDLTWQLALPIGVDRDHEYCNPMVVDCLDEKLDKIKGLGWRVLVSGNGEDPLVDRQKELAKLMAEKGVQVIEDFQEEGAHAVEYGDPSVAEQLIELVKGFIFQCGA